MIKTTYFCDRCKQETERLWTIGFVSDVGQPSGANQLCTECCDEFRDEFLRPRVVA